MDEKAGLELFQACFFVVWLSTMTKLIDSISTITICNKLILTQRIERIDLKYIY
jgi:hypothetical protein